MTITGRRPLRRGDVLRFLDLAFHAGGLIKGDRIMDKLRLNHRSELVRFALRVGLLKEM